MSAIGTKRTWVLRCKCLLLAKADKSGVVLLPTIKSECYDFDPSADGADDAFEKRILRSASVVRTSDVLSKFEHICIMVLTALIAIIIVLAMWNLTLKILLSVLSTNFNPTDYGVFQAVFGTIFTVIIALEFKRSLLVLAERSDSVVQVRAVVLIALLAVVRKLIILDLSSTDAFHLLALAAAILALGAVYWLVRIRAGVASVFGLNCTMSVIGT